MQDERVPEPLSNFLANVYHVEVDDVAGWKEQVEAGIVSPEKVQLLRSQLADAIRTRSISPQTYKRLTSDNEQASNDDVAAALAELWTEMFGDDPVPA